MFEFITDNMPLFTFINTVLLIILIYFVKEKKIKKAIKKVLKRTIKSLKMVFFRLSKIIAKDSRLVIFGSGNGTLFSDNPKYLFIKALNDSDVKAIWITASKNVLKEMKKEGYNCYYVFSLKGIITQLRSKVGVVSHSPFYDFSPSLVGGAIIVNTWHGVGLKKVSYANKSSLNYRRYYHSKRYIRILQRYITRLLTFKDYYYFSTSKSVSSYYPETFLVKKDKVIELGQARNDIFFDDSLDTKNFPEFIKNNKIITYMPTHRNDGKTEDSIEDLLDLSIIEEFCSKYNYTFLIKKHFYSNEAKLKRYKNIINIGNTEIDPQMLLKYTDILITDYSSCYTDFLLLNRPVLFYCYDYNEYITKDRQMYFDYDDVTPGPKCITFNSLVKSLEKIMLGQDEYIEDRKRVLDIFYSKENQGKTADKQWQYIKKNIMKL